MVQLHIYILTLPAYTLYVGRFRQHDPNIMFLQLIVTVYSFTLSLFLFKTQSNIFLQSLASLPSYMYSLNSKTL